MRRGPVLALHDVDLTLGGPGITGIVGPNGAGKSTLLDVISGFRRPTRGHVQLDSVLLDGLPPWDRARRGICRTFQDDRLSPARTAEEHVSFAMTAQSGETLLRAFSPASRHRHAEVRARARERLALVGLADADRPVADLSRGQQRLVAISMALATNGSVLLLDEPTTGLDAQARATMERLVCSIGEDGRLVVVVDHDVAFVQRLSSRTVVLKHGRIVADSNDSPLDSKVLRSAFDV